MWNWAALQTLFTCWPSVKLFSRWTPRFLMVLTGLIEILVIDIDSTWFSSFTWCRYRGTSPQIWLDSDTIHFVWTNSELLVCTYPECRRKWLLIVERYSGKVEYHRHTGGMKCRMIWRCWLGLRTGKIAANWARYPDRRQHCTRVCPIWHYQLWHTVIYPWGMFGSI